MNENTDLAVIIKRGELTEVELTELNKLLADDPDVLKALGACEVKNEDLARPPYMKVSSRNNPVKSPDGETVPPGHLVIMPAATIHAPMFEAVIIAHTPNTFAWLGDFSKGEPPVCLSDEHGLFPIAQGGGRIVTNPQAGPCRKPDAHGVPQVFCTHAHWGDLDPETGKNEKPTCRKQLGFVLWPLDVMEDAVVFRTHSTANTYCGQELNSLLMKLGSAYRITMTTRLVSNDSTANEWYVPIVIRGKKLTDAELLATLRIKGQWKGVMPAADYAHDDFETGEAFVPDPDADVIDGVSKGKVQVPPPF